MSKAQLGGIAAGSFLFGALLVCANIAQCGVVFILIGVAFAGVVWMKIESDKRLPQATIDSLNASLAVHRTLNQPKPRASEGSSRVFVPPPLSP